MVISLMTGPTSVPWVTNSNDLTINVINNTDLSMEIKTSKYFSVYGRIGRSPWTSLLQTTQQQQQQQQQQDQQKEVKNNSGNLDVPTKLDQNLG